VPGDARAHDAATDYDCVCRFGHAATILPQRHRRSEDK
jgi:hypothetical protein